MPIAKATCPECGAKLSSPDGFEIGEEVECPKCDTEFKVRAPKPVKPKVVDDDDDEEERPKSKTKKPVKRKPVDDEDDDDDDEDERPKKRGSRRDDEKSYKNSPLRFIILGVLVLIMLVGGFFLVKKILADRAAAGLQPAGVSLTRTAAQTSAITLFAVA